MTTFKENHILLLEFCYNSAKYASKFSYFIRPKNRSLPTPELKCCILKNEKK